MRFREGFEGFEGFEVCWGVAFEVRQGGGMWEC